MTMHVTVLFFGHYRDVVPEGTVSLELPLGTTVAEVATVFATRDARLADLLMRTRTAVNSDFAPADTTLQDGDELAFLPPMSGG